MVIFEIIEYNTFIFTDKNMGPSLLILAAIVLPIFPWPG